MSQIVSPDVFFSKQKTHSERGVNQISSPIQGATFSLHLRLMDESKFLQNNPRLGIHPQDVEPGGWELELPPKNLGFVDVFDVEFVLRILYYGKITMLYHHFRRLCVFIFSPGILSKSKKHVGEK